MTPEPSHETLEKWYGDLDREVWVFGYGSLMWRPGFAFVEERAARLCGYHRGLVIKSVEYRGTPENPGLVLGLDRGGSCVGRAFRVAAMDAPEAFAHLHGREMIHETYNPRWLSVTLDDDRKVSALAYVVRPEHPQYAGKLSMESMVHMVLNGHGQMGPAWEYLDNTVAHLDAMGIKEGPLHKILRAVKRAQA